MKRVKILLQEFDDEKLLEMARNSIGRVGIETVEEMQNQIITMVNLQSVDGEIFLVCSIKYYLGTVKK